MRLPEIDDLIIKPLLGLIAVIEPALIVIARSLRGSHPDIDRLARPGDDPETAAARQIVDDCDALLYALDHYRDLVDAQLRRRPCSTDYPF
jgi:hypothetical protein